ncbi:MAG TPA: hypothetical protein VHO47_02230 [Candidatus Babeliales bacterium]|nr:hypothetical protein [Candidatus Babeliales bacterium]
MKKLLFCLLLISSTAYSDCDCMDNSQHGDTSWGYDYKKYYYVGDCTCPCWRYARSFRRNKCERCGHFNVPRPIMPKKCEEKEIIG